MLQSDSGDADARSSAQIETLEAQTAALQGENSELQRENAEFEERVPSLEEQIADLQQSLDDLGKSAEGSAAEAESLVGGPGTLRALRGETRREGRLAGGEPRRGRETAQEADAALAEANETTARVRDRVAAQRARAELAEACLAGVADILRRFYAGEDLAASIERTTEELEEIATECE